MMYCDPIQAEYLEAKKKETGIDTWKMVHDTAFWSDFGGNIDRWIVPAGFETDLASTPRFLWPIFPPFGLHLRAAIVHDYLYATGAVPRVMADAMFMSLMETYGVPPWRRWFMYLAVRMFGGVPFKEHAKRREAQKEK